MLRRVRSGPTRRTILCSVRCMRRCVSSFEALAARAATDPILTGNRGALTTVQDLEAPLAVQSAPSRPGSFPLNKFNAVQLLIRASRVAEAEAQQAAP